MRVLVAGSSGLIGSALTARLRASGHEVRRLVRRPARAGDEHSWDPPAGKIDTAALDGVDAVVNLCGSPMGLRWSAARKQLISDSRIEPTEVLAEAVAEHDVATLINASGVNYYGEHGAAALDESAPAGRGFLAELCARWEAATGAAARSGARVVRLRTGPVLSAQGGLLATLKPLFRCGLGGRLGPGNQYMPWIGLDDHVAVLLFALERDTLAGAVNSCAPNPATNAEFTRTLGRRLGRPTPWRVPSVALRAALGDVADNMALISQRVLPGKLERAGFDFTHPDLDSALAAVL